jgi:hypothetical protein
MNSLKGKMPEGLFDELLDEVTEATVFGMPLATMTSDELAVMILLIGKKRQADLAAFSEATVLSERAYARSRRSFWWMTAAFLMAASAASFYAALYYFP